MAVLRVVVADNPAALLDASTAGFFANARDATTASHAKRSWLVLRQGGLRDDVRIVARARGVELDDSAPLCIFSELPARWGSVPTRAMEPEARRALLSTLIARHGARLFARGGNTDAWVGAVDAVIADLVSDGITPTAFGNALAARDGRDDFEAARDATILAIYDDYVRALTNHDRCDGRDALVRLASDIERSGDEFAGQLSGIRDVRIAGLADLRGGWRSLLTALVSSRAVDTVTLFTTHQLDLPAALHAETIAAERPSVRPPCTVHALEAPDSAREIEIIATRVRALLDAGAVPSRIAVVAREARPMVDDMAVALGRLDVAVTARRRVALSCTGPARALRALLDGAANGWPLHSLVGIAENPLLRVPFDRATLHVLARMAPLALPSDLTEALNALIIRCRLRDQTERPGRRDAALPETARVVATLEELEKFANERLEMGESRSLGAWLDWTVDTLTSARWNVDAALRAGNTDDAIASTDIRARDRIVEIALAWREANEAFRDQSGEADANGATRLLSAESFASVLAGMLAEDLVMQPDTDTGVVVSEALAAAWRAFDHVFIVGLSDGAFPARPQRSPILGDAERAALIAYGLPLDAPDAWRHRERELFRVLCAAPSTSLTLSWPAVDAEGGETVRSGFVDEFGLHDAMVSVPAHEVLTAGFPLVARPVMDLMMAHARRVAGIERERGRTASPYNGAIADPHLLRDIETRLGAGYTWSATSIEELAKCPWSWMANRLLELEEREEADDAIEPKTTGTILHRALERFFDEARVHVGGPVFLRKHDESWAAPLAERALREAWEEESRRSWLGVPALRALAHGELLHQLRKYLRFEIAYNEKSFNNRSPVSKNIRTGALNGELQFDDVTIARDGTSFRLRGTIDRVDIGVDERVPDAASYMVAIDYKSSKSSTPAAGSKSGWDDGVVLQVPLYAEAIQQLFRDRTLARLEYRTLRSPEIVHSLQFRKLDKVSKSGKQEVIPGDAEAQFEAALRHAAKHIADARAGSFPARPTGSCGCSPYCPARDACRIPGGPVERAR